MIDYAILRDGTRAGARAGVYMRSVVRIGSPGEAVYVRDARWTRYRDDGRHKRMTGHGVVHVPMALWAPSNMLPMSPGAYSIVGQHMANPVKRDFALRWPQAMAYLEGLQK